MSENIAQDAHTDKISLVHEILKVVSDQPMTEVVAAMCVAMATAINRQTHDRNKALRLAKTVAEQLYASVEATSVEAPAGLVRAQDASWREGLGFAFSDV